MAFFDDRLAMPDRYGDDHAHTVEYGIRCVKMDPVIVLTTMGMATEKLGLASTCSTTYYEPFDVARRFATLDLMTGGRAAWNVVTSVNDGEAHNMGKDAHLDHDFRYDRADEFMEVVLGHWDSWEDGSLLIDKKSGRFADPTKVKRLDHNGQFYKSRGPFTVPRSQQGHPVIIQAGASGRGQRFAGRWGEVIFTAARNLAGARQGYDAVRNEAAKAGRDPDQMFLCNLTTPVCGATKSEAEDRMALIEKLPLEIDALSLLSEGLNYDFASKGIDEPLTTAELESMQGIIGIRDGVLKTSGKTNPSARDFITFSGRGQTADAIVGGPKEIADKLEEMFVGRGCDGFVIAATYVPGLLRGFRPPCRSGIAAPRAVSQGLCRQDLARKSRPAAPGRRRLENPAAGRGGIRRNKACAGLNLPLMERPRGESSKATASSRSAAIPSGNGSARAHACPEGRQDRTAGDAAHLLLRRPQLPQASQGSRRQAGKVPEHSRPARDRLSRAERADRA